MANYAELSLSHQNLMTLHTRGVDYTF